jgi:hypothetical protein
LLNDLPNCRKSRKCRRVREDGDRPANGSNCSRGLDIRRSPAARPARARFSRVSDMGIRWDADHNGNRGGPAQSGAWGTCAGPNRSQAGVTVERRTAGTKIVSSSHAMQCGCPATAPIWVKALQIVKSPQAASNRATWAGAQRSRPAGVRTPRASNSWAMAASVVRPAPGSPQQPPAS